MLNDEKTAVSQEDLRGLMMKLADASDLLRTLLSDAPDRADFKATGDNRRLVHRAPVIADCTVTIHQLTIHQHLGDPPPQSPPAAVAA